MKPYVLVLLLTFVNVLRVFGYDCGKPFFQPVVPDYGRQRIVGGSTAIAHSFPSTVRITYDNGDGSYTLCGGSIVSESISSTGSNKVITAAHCVLDDFGTPLNTARFTVYAGDHNRLVKESNEVRAGVRSFKVHSSYDPDTNRNDIAVIRLNITIPYNNYVKPICLPYSNQMPSNPYTGCISVGWGRISNTNNAVATYLQQSRMPVILNCTNPLIWGRTVDLSCMVCAGGLDGRANACNGDSGGPLICMENERQTLFGVVSFGRAKACASPNKPAVYTRVSSYMSWISMA